MLGFALLLLFNLAGLALHDLLHVPLPGNVIGLLLLLAALTLRLVKLEWIEAPAQFLLRHMMLFFVPYVIAVVRLRQTLADNWLALLGGMVFSTLLAMAVTGWIAQWLAPREESRRAD